jgi:hypothetical protein
MELQELMVTVWLQIIIKEKYEKNGLLILFKKI